MNKVAEWSDNNALKMYAKKREEVVFGSMSDSDKVPTDIHKQVLFLIKYLGVTIDHLLSRRDHAESGSIRKN